MSAENDGPPVVPDCTFLLESARRIASGSMDTQTRTACARYGVSWEVARHARNTAGRRLAEATPQTFPELTDLAALPPGAFDPRILEQGEVWIDYFRRSFVIWHRDEFTDAHLNNVCHWLADHVIELRAWHRRTYPPQPLDDELTDLEWLSARPLSWALRLEQTARGPGPELRRS